MQSTGMVIGVDIERSPLSCVGPLLKRKRPGPVEMALSTSFPVKNATNCIESYSCRGEDKQRNGYLSRFGDFTGNGSTSDSKEVGEKKRKIFYSPGTNLSDRVCMIPEPKNRRKHLPRLVQPTIDGRGIIREATGIACHACGAHATAETDIHTDGKSDEKGTKSREKQQQLYMSPCPRNGFFLSHSPAVPAAVSPPPHPLSKCRHCEKLACNRCLRQCERCGHEDNCTFCVEVDFSQSHWDGFVCMSCSSSVCDVAAGKTPDNSMDCSC